MKINKIITILLVAIILLNMLQIKVQALEVEKAYLEELGECERHLQYKKAETGNWSYIITTMVGYRIGENIHYAYCLNMEKPGVGEVGSYEVNVSQILNDERIWRCIINGFPYKTPYEMGVANEQDAYVATKQAIYSVLAERDVESYYQGVDGRGKQILNAIITMVNEARNGIYTPTTTDLLNAFPVGEFQKENEEYYSQTYKISSNVEIDDYNITNIIGFPEGSYIEKIDSEFNGFKVLIPKNKILEDINGTINLEASLKTYPVFFGESYDSNLQNYALTYNAYTNLSSEIELNIKADKSKLKIIKIDKETKEPISGVEFNVKYENGIEIGNFITNENGIINIEGLKQGKIIITELKSREEYIFNNDSIDVSIDYDEVYEIIVTNKKIKVELPEELKKIEEEKTYEQPKLPVTGM